MRSRLSLRQHQTDFKNRVIAAFNRYGLREAQQDQDLFRGKGRLRLSVYTGRLPDHTREATTREWQIIDELEQHVWCLSYTPVAGRCFWDLRPKSSIIYLRWAFVEAADVIVTRPSQPAWAERHVTRQYLKRAAAEPQELMDGQCRLAAHQMSPDFCGAREVEEAGAELVLQTCVQLPVESMTSQRPRTGLTLSCIRGVATCESCTLVPARGQLTGIRPSIVRSCWVFRTSASCT